MIGLSINFNCSFDYWKLHNFHRSNEVIKRTERKRKVNKECENCSTTKSTFWGCGDSKLLCGTWFVNFLL